MDHEKTTEDAITMKYLFVTAILLLMAMPVTQAQTTITSEDAKTEEELRKLEREWLNAYDNNDVTAMKRIVADDFTITYENGMVISKAQTIAHLKPGAPKDPNSSQWTEDSVVRTYGNAAVISGRYISKHRDKEKDIVRESRYTDTYIKRNGRWQVVASQLTSIVKK